MRHIAHEYNHYHTCSRHAPLWWDILYMNIITTTHAVDMSLVVRCIVHEYNHYHTCSRHVPLWWDTLYMYIIAITHAVDMRKYPATSHQYASAMTDTLTFVRHFGTTGWMLILGNAFGVVCVVLYMRLLLISWTTKRLQNYYIKGACFFGEREGGNASLTRTHGES